jgi:PiT family inorganic phosphate transporter
MSAAGAHPHVTELSARLRTRLPGPDLTQRQLRERSWWSGPEAWVIVVAGLAIGLGTYSGGWRIMRTLGRRIVDLDPPKAFAAESTAALVLYGMAIAVHAPVSTTHTIASAVLGAGVTSGASAVRWAVVRRIVSAWVITLPAAAALSAAVYGLGVLVT